MNSVYEIIDLSDEDGDVANESHLEYERDFLAIDNEIGDEVEARNMGLEREIRPSHICSTFDSYESCLREVLEIFPDVSYDYVQQIYNKHIEVMGPFEKKEDTVARRVIEEILDSGTYPKEKDRIRELKRKRTDKDVDEEEAAKWRYMHLRDDPIEYCKVARAALHEAFEYVPIRFIQEKFKEHGHYYGAFFAILKAELEYNPVTHTPFPRLKARRTSNGPDANTMMTSLPMAGIDFDGLKEEMLSAERRKKREDAQRQAAKEVEQVEAARDAEYIAKGEVMDCGCCCETVTMPRMTHCDGDEPHFFCLDCARKNANNDIGNSQYKLRCMDFSGCIATFSREQRLRFLDEKTMAKLERLQQQQELRSANLDNLSTCPFCDFAAICPPIGEDREFRCHNLECQEVSCRLCKSKSHVPLTCQEHKKENGISERRVIEEARTEALIRTCSKCKVHILKEDGCNKVICTSCYAVLCDYCGKDISKALYNHFNSEGGHAPSGTIIAPGGKCPLYDESNKRKDHQVDVAEKEAVMKVRADHPEISEEDLRIKFAKDVQQPSTRNHHHKHHGRHQAWAAPPPFPYGYNGFEDPPPLFGGRQLNRQADVAGPMPDAFPKLNVGHQQQWPRQRQQRVLQTHGQAQQLQRQAEHRLNELLVQQRAHLENQAQDHIARAQARIHANLNAIRQNFIRDGAMFERDEAFGNNGWRRNIDPFVFNPFPVNDLHDRPNQPAHRHHIPHDPPAGDQALHQRIVSPQLNARRAGDPARRVVTESQEVAPHSRQRREPRDLLRRNDVGIETGVVADNPWF